MPDGSIAAPSLTLNDVIMTSMLLLKIIKNVIANFFVLSDTLLFNYFSLLLLHVFKMTSSLFCANLVAVSWAVSKLIVERGAPLPHPS